jgi:uncharacterized membrane protein YqjE
MNPSDPQPAGLFDSLGRLANAGLSLVHNRAELLSVELQEERTRFLEVLLWMALFLFFGIVFVLVLTATIVMICPPDVRIYVAGAFSFLYLVGALWAYGQYKKRMVSSQPLAQTIDETKKDRDLLIGELSART